MSRFAIALVTLLAAVTASTVAAAGNVRTVKVQLFFALNFDCSALGRRVGGDTFLASAGKAAVADVRTALTQRVTPNVSVTVSPCENVVVSSSAHSLGWLSFRSGGGTS